MAGIDLGIDGLTDAEPVGSGGNAVVYRAYEAAQDRWVAVKVLRGHGDEAELRRFDRERRAMGRLAQHEGIVTIHYSGFTSRREPFLVMPFIEAGSLQDRLDTGGAVPWQEAVRLIAEVADTVDWAHDENVVHRDLKPGNIMLSQSGRPLVADFGIAKRTGASASMQSTAITLTPAYSPPEVISGAPSSRAADVYALGATLFAMIVGTPPFSTGAEDENVFALLQRIGTEPVPDLRDSGVPDHVCAAIEAAMQKSTDDRPETTAAFAAMLREGATDEVVPSHIPVDTATTHIVEPPVAPAPVDDTPPLTPPIDPAPDLPPQPEPARPWRRRVLAGSVLLGLVVIAGLVARAAFDSPDETATETIESPATTSGGSEPTSSTSRADNGEAAAGGGDSAATTVVTFEPLIAGSAGELRIHVRDEVPSLNPHPVISSSALAVAGLVVEPLAEYDDVGLLLPVLAAQIPTASNGGLSADRVTVTWTLRPGIVWSDGTPLTSGDVVFTWQWCEATPGCALPNVADVQAIDELTVRVRFAGEPKPREAFVGPAGAILQRSQFEPCLPDPTSCPANSAPIGTGPYVVSSNEPGGGITFDINDRFRDRNEGLPRFGQVTVVPPVDSAQAAGMVLQNGEVDFALDLTAPDVPGQLTDGQTGVVMVSFASNVESLNLNQTDPNGPRPSDFDGGSNPNPFFFDNGPLAMALSLAIDRAALAASAYGPLAVPTCNMWNLPRERSSNNDACLDHNPDEATRILDDLGYLDTNGDGVRELPDGTPLRWELVTSDVQARRVSLDFIAAAWRDVGIELATRAAAPGEFFDGTAQSDASIWRFLTDIQMFTNGWQIPDAEPYLVGWSTSAIPQLSNGWAGANIPRLSHPEYDALLDELAGLPLDDSRRRDVIVRLNDILSTSGSTIPLLLRGSAHGVSRSLTGVAVNEWDNQFWNIERWDRA